MGFSSEKIVMLRKRSRPVGSKQSSQCSSSSPLDFPEKIAKPTSHFFNSPKFLQALLTIFNFEAHTMMNSAAFSPFPKPLFSFDRKIPATTNPATKHKHHLWHHKEPRGLGLGPLGLGLALVEESNENNNSESGPSPSPKQGTKLVLFGSQLNIKVPSPPPLLPPQNSTNYFSSNYSPTTAEFGTKTPRSNNGGEIQPQLMRVREAFSLEEIEMSEEDYTCVISHGPNPKTTHIYRNCVVVDTSCGEVPSPAAKRKKKKNKEVVVFSWSENPQPLSSPQPQPQPPPPENFLRFCNHCNAELCQGKDIYMYRGEMGFCSQECRIQEMHFDAMENN
ncbi:zinc-finger of the FCS-type, C2-C2 [Dionaea muscipula]